MNWGDKRGYQLSDFSICLKYPVWYSSYFMEQCAVVRFFTDKRPSAQDGRTELEGVSGYEALLFSASKKYRKCFAKGEIISKTNQDLEHPRKAFSPNPYKLLSRIILL
jgi:hypothetical protein